ncbi:transcriptional repressor [Phyllobacterium salinisoli]|uniref:Ferric uptake regulation protein n=1 Tax=Phyllobacterium salinisoli TaxID=1899321 RepID=A0A368JWI5_9HYPH|nr:transcriptional repressor [Phyllobacterium salinisoli]
MRKRIETAPGTQDAPVETVRAILKQAGLRPTRQRLALGRLLFRAEHCHVTVDDLHGNMLDRGMRLSLATVYNTLNQFAHSGLVRKVAIPGGPSYFDTDAGDHQHFYIEEEGRIIDVPAGSVVLGQLPAPPESYAIAGVDVVVRLRRVEAVATTPCTRCGKCRAAFREPETAGVPRQLCGYSDKD